MSSGHYRIIPLLAATSLRDIKLIQRRRYHRRCQCRYYHHQHLFDSLAISRDDLGLGSRVKRDPIGLLYLGGETSEWTNRKEFSIFIKDAFISLGIE